MKFTKTFDVNYYRYLHSEEPLRTQTRQFSHKYTETWELTENFCPCCGKREVWLEQGGGDYYVGQQYICMACDSTFHMPNSQKCTDDADRQRLERLRS